MGENRISMDEAVIDIRQRYKRRDQVHGGIALAKEFGVTPQAISLALHRKSWAHIGD